ncbi:MAG: hypothetical protein A2X92_00205 [Syntrophus sp. GWC2_56_31]|nr:MAG: hypothetical protein A2X92_00205 [Syntrophus sp. GWC2_56_31]
MKKCRLAIGLLFCLFLPAMGAAGESYTFDPAEIEKKPYHLGGYVEFKPLLFGLDREAAFYKLRFYNAPQGQTLPEWNGRVQLEGSYERGFYRVYARTNTDLKDTYAGTSERTVFHEAYVSVKPSSSLKVETGKKVMRWGKGYAWSPAAFVDRPKDPDDPELALEGYIVATADYIKSFDGPLKTFSFTPVLLPVYENVNDGFGTRNQMNVAGRFYFLLYDTDIDLLFLTGGSRTDRYGVDFSRNISTNLEIHGEFAYIRNHQKNVLDAAGKSRLVEGDARSYLAGIRYLTTFDLTTIVEYYHNDTGFGGDDMKNYYAFIDRGYELYNATGNASTLVNAQTMAEGAYGRSNSMRDYLYVRLSQKEPFDILYLTPALTWMTNLEDKSFSLTPELLYTGITNLELRFRTTFIIGAKNTEFGEKQNDYRIEFRIGYYF